MSLVQMKTGNTRTTPVGRRQNGFTIIELLIVMTVMGILARFAIPAYENIVTKARAADIAGDFHVIKTAAISYNAENHTWPPDTNAGSVPPGLVEFLPDGFTFQRDGYQFDWDNWELPDGTPKHPGTGVLLGISIKTDNQALGQELVNLIGGSHAHMTLSSHYTFVIETM